jgi:hypothetical protein
MPEDAKKVGRRQGELDPKGLQTRPSIAIHLKAMMPAAP